MASCREPEFREILFKIWVGPKDEENFAKFGWVAALSRLGLSFAKFSRFVGALTRQNFCEIYVIAGSVQGAADTKSRYMTKFREIWVLEDQ